MNFPCVLTIIFVIAKLVGLIAWSWLVVFSPFLIGVAFLLTMIGVAALITER